MKAWWHGGVPDLRPGDLIEPGHGRAAHDGCPWCEARADGEAGPGGLDGPSGNLLPQVEVPSKIYSYISRESKNLGNRSLPAGVTFQDALDRRGEDWILGHPWSLLDETRDREGLREYLNNNRSYRQQSYYLTQYAKLAVTLDWLMYGPPNEAKS